MHTGDVPIKLKLDCKNAIKHEYSDHHHTSILFLSQPPSTLPKKEAKNLKDPPGISTTVRLRCQINFYQEFQTSGSEKLEPE